MTSISLDEAKYAKEILKERLRLPYPSWLRGIGISFDKSNNYCIKVNVETITQEVNDIVPKNIENVSIIIEAVGNIVAG